MKTSRKTVLLLLLFAIVFSGSVKAQDPLAYLNQTFPKLTNLYRDELKKYPAHYVFAIDVSGTMNKFEPDVLGALRPFFNALPDGDRVDVIPFGGTNDPNAPAALDNMVQYCGIINADVKQSLINNLGKFYNDPSYPEGFKGYTYVDAAVKAVTNSLKNNRNYKVNIVVLLTDFRNENPQERQFTDAELQDMHDAFTAASNEIYTRTIALELPIDHKVKGYCLPQLRDKVFDSSERGLEIVPMGVSGDMIGQWFEQLKREIMVDKLRAVITAANRVNPARLIVDTDIDGNVKAEIHWAPSKLYPSMKIDSTYVGQKGFYFENNKEAFVNTRDSVIGVDPELLLGKIVYDSWGFHHFADSLHLGINLPTEYDNELASLNVKKPIPQTTRAEDKWIFTFFLPFWLTATIVVLIILYIIGVIKAIARNGKLTFTGKVTFYNTQGYQIDDAKKIPTQSSNAQITIGSSSNVRATCPGADWMVTIIKVKSNPFLVFPKPYFQWKATKGYAAAGSSQSGKLDYGSCSSTRLKCGHSRSDITHQCKIQMLS